MINKLHVTATILLAGINISISQTNFRAGWEKANPVPKDSPFSIKEKIKAHQAFLKEAEKEGNPLEQIYGHLYLVYDYCHALDYANATEAVHKAQAIADKADNPGWQGWVMHRKANISSALEKYENALLEYEKAAELCGAAKDSLCVAESLEQVSWAYNTLNDFTNAVRVSRIAMPLIEKFGGEAQLGVALSNLGLIFLGQPGKEAESIPYFERSIAIFEKLGRPQDVAKTMGNLSSAYLKFHQYDKALALQKACMRINEEHNFTENLPDNYWNISAIHKQLGNYRTANEFLEKSFNLTDSLVGVETKLKIAEFEVKYATQQKELELEKSKFALHTAEQVAERQTWLIILALMLAVFSWWRWWHKTQQAKKEQSHYRSTLEDLTRILLEKNTRLLALEAQSVESLAAEKTPILSTDFEGDVFNQTILTDSDWSAFKSWFEKAHPGFLLRLRKTFPGITDAEERLFLFIKLNLHTKESANILGISVNSVKRTRNRLRHRLGLTEEVDLDEFIRAF